MGRVITGVIPPTGWHYMESADRIDAPTYEDLHSALEHYRVMNAIPLGDIAADIENQICERYPHQCRNGQVLSSTVKVTRRTSKSPMTQLLDDILAWARPLLVRPQAFITVTKNVAESRAQICSACPAMVKYRGCPDCVADVERRGAQIRSGQDVPSSRRIRGCSAWRFDARSAVFLDRPHLPEFPKNQPPAACWLTTQ